MNVLKTILDFILSVGHLFFRRNGKKGRQFCPRCGARLSTDSPCGCCNPPDRSSTGSHRCPDGMEETGEPGETVNADAEETVDGEEEPPSFSLLAEDNNIQQLTGWSLMLLATGHWIVTHYL